MDKHKFLVFSATSDGGLAEHIYYQARALQQEGDDVCLLTTKSFLPGKMKTIPFKPVLQSMSGNEKAGILRKIKQVWILCVNYYILAFYTLKRKPKVVLVDSYREYLSVLWAWPVKIAARIAGAICVVNLHDPVRDYIVGPVWFHNWSVKLGYSFISIGLVHAQVSEKAKIPAHVKIVEVPVGVYDLPEATKSITVVRESWGAHRDHNIFLSFGYIRDNKNIDLLIKAIARLENTFLVVAGKPQSSSDKPMSHYQQLARELGVHERCFFYNDFIPEAELGNYFRSVEFVALTYSSTFYSQSGVLNLAAASKLKVLASGADSPLTRSVNTYKLGAVVAPDSLPDIIAGIRTLINSPIEPDWKGYYDYAGWPRNVKSLKLAVTELQHKHH